MQCPDCGTEVEQSAQYCRECGLDIERHQAQRPTDAAAESDESADVNDDRPANSQADPAEASRAAAAATETAAQTGQAKAGAGSSQASRATRKQPAATQQGDAASQQQRWGDSGGSAGTAATRRQQPAPSATPTQSGFSVPVVQAAVYGALAFAASYALTYALYAYELGQQTADFTAPTAEKVEVAGWLVYSAHGAVLDVSFEDYPEGAFTINIVEHVYGAFGAENVDFVGGTQWDALQLFFGTDDAVSESLGVSYAGDAYGAITSSAALPKFAFYAVPLVVLVGAGYTLTRRVARRRRLTDRERALVGASVAVGYAVVAVAGALTVFSVSGTGDSTMTIAPQLEATVIFVGVLYPAVAGGLGGLLSG